MIPVDPILTVSRSANWMLEPQIQIEKIVHYFSKIIFSCMTENLDQMLPNKFLSYMLRSS